MANSLSHSSLNSVQLHLLKMFSFNKQKKNLKELKEILFEYYKNKIDADADVLWDEKQWDEEKMEQMLNSHKRTPYK